MSVSAAIRQMMAAGLTLEQALTAAEVMEAANKPEKSSAAIRQQRYRDRKKADEGITRDVTCITSITRDEQRNDVTPEAASRVVYTKLPSEVVIYPLTSPSGTSPPSKKSLPRPARRAPESWTPSERTLGLLRDDGYSPGELERALTRLRDWEFRTARSDWDAAYRTWVRRDPPQTINGRPNVEQPDPKRLAREANLARAFTGSQAGSRLRSGG